MFSKYSPWLRLGSRGPDLAAAVVKAREREREKGGARAVVAAT